MVMYIRPAGVRGLDVSRWFGRGKQYPNLRAMRTVNELAHITQGVYINDKAEGNDWRQHNLAYAVLVEVTSTLQLVYKVRTKSTLHPAGFQ